MRYVMFFVSLGMFMLVACPQQRLPELRPQLPEPDGKDSTVKKIRPTPFNQPSALNPGNIRIELESNPSELIKELGKDESGVQQYSIQLETGYINPWVVRAMADDDVREIMLASFPNYSSKIRVFKDEDAGFIEVHRYSFQMEYDKEDRPIEPMELQIVARNMSYCRNLISKSQDGAETAVNGIEPNIPETETDCDTMNNANIYNFDQRIRLKLLVENVQSKEEMRKDEIKFEFKQKIFCSVFKKAMNAAIKEVTTRWSSSNAILNLGKEIGVDFATGFFNYKMSLKGYDCSEYEKNNGRLGPGH